MTVNEAYRKAAEAANVVERLMLQDEQKDNAELLLAFTHITKAEGILFKIGNSRECCG